MNFRSLFLVLIVMLALSGAGLAWLRLEAGAPQVTAPSSLLLGRDGASFEIVAADARSGVRSLRAVLVHARGEAMLLDRSLPGELLGRGGVPVSESLRLDPSALDLRDGDAVLRIAVRDHSWRDGFAGNLTELAIPVTIDLTPPRVRVESGLTYVKRGGAAAVVYRLSEPVERDGVEVGAAFFRGAPHPQDAAGGERRVAVFAVPADAPPSPQIRVVARDAAGNIGEAGWPARVQERKFPEVDIVLPASMLETKVPELAAAHDIDESDPVAAFREVNTALRARNEARLRDLIAGKPGPARFEGAFLQLRNSAVTSRFAERRSYLVQGEKVSEATHFGYDLASLAASPVQAANAGVVRFAGPLGIYGNCVLLDHGLGITTLYGHLSRIDVSEGESVDRGAVLGLSGATGLAGGDHLHFAVLVGDTYVDPLEWWDPKWVREHITVRLLPEAP